MSLAPILRQSLKVNLSGWRPGSATRCALVLGVILIGGSLLGHPAWGVAAAIGAFNAGLASLSGVYRTRLRTMVQVCLVTFVCALIGGLVGTSLPLSVLTLTAGCLIFTLYGELTPSAATLTLQATMTLLILSGLRLPPESALTTALLVLLGGAAQVLVLGVLWPLGRYQPERRSVSLTFASLADFVQHWKDPGPRPASRLFPDDQPFRDALAALGSVSPTSWRHSHDGLRGVLEKAEGLRAALISLGLEPWTHEQGEKARLFRRVLVRVLTQLRQAVRQGQEQPISSGALRALQVAARRAAPAGDLTRSESPLTLTLSLLERLSVPEVKATTPDPEPGEGAPAPSSPSVLNLRPTPAEWQHSLRLALAVGLSDLAVRLLNLPHGYWLPLTVGLVLRADYLTTVTRGAARLLGTLAAVLLGLLLGLAHPTPQLDTLLVLVAAWLAYALLQVGYAPFSAAVSLYVIASVSASGLSQGVVAEGRLLYTVMGGVLALIAFLIWPIWQAGTARERLRQVAQRQQEYAESLLDFAAQSNGVGRPSSVSPNTPPDDRPVEAARTAARDARLAAEGAVMAAAVEPRWASRSAPVRTFAQPTMARLSGNAAHLLALHLTLRNGGTGTSDTRAALEHSRQLAEQTARELD